MKKKNKKNIDFNILFRSKLEFFFFTSYRVSYACYFIQKFYFYSQTSNSSSYTKCTFHTYIDSREDMVIIEWNILGTRRLVRWNELAKHGLGYSRHPINPRLYPVNRLWLTRAIEFSTFSIIKSSLSLYPSKFSLFPSPLDNHLSIRSKPRFNFPFPLPSLKYRANKFVWNGENFHLRDLERYWTGVEFYLFEDRWQETYHNWLERDLHAQYTTRL